VWSPFPLLVTKRCGYQGSLRQPGIIGWTSVRRLSTSVCQAFTWVARPWEAPWLRAVHQERQEEEEGVGVHSEASVESKHGNSTHHMAGLSLSSLCTRLSSLTRPPCAVVGRACLWHLRLTRRCPEEKSLPIGIIPDVLVRRTANASRCPRNVLVEVWIFNARLVTQRAYFLLVEPTTESSPFAENLKKQ